MDSGQLKADIQAIATFSQEASTLAGDVSNLATKYTNVTTMPDFGHTVAPDFARPMTDAYFNLLGKFVHQGSNLTNLADQLTLLSQGAGQIVKEYQAGVLDESNAVSRFQQLLDDPAASTVPSSTGA